MSRSKIEQAERDMERCMCTPAEWVGRVQAGDLDGAPHASVWVCGLAAHREAAERYCREATDGRHPRWFPKVQP